MSSISVKMLAHAGLLIAGLLMTPAVVYAIDVPPGTTGQPGPNDGLPGDNFPPDGTQTHIKDDTVSGSTRNNGPSAGPVIGETHERTEAGPSSVLPGDAHDDNGNRVTGGNEAGNGPLSSGADLGNTSAGGASVH